MQIEDMTAHNKADRRQYACIFQLVYLRRAHELSCEDEHSHDEQEERKAEVKDIQRFTLCNGEKGISHDILYRFEPEYPVDKGIDKENYHIHKGSDAYKSQIILYQRLYARILTDKDHQSRSHS